jgi:hypothetical protein
MRSLVFTLLLVGVTALAVPATAQEQQPDEPEPAVTREAIQDKKQEIRELKRELKHQEVERRRQHKRQGQARLRKLGPTPLWVSLGLNGSHIEHSQQNCGGFQGAVSLGKVLMLRGEYSQLSYESHDDTNSCDAAIGGDSDFNDRAGLLGFRLGRSGAFLVAGPTRVHVDKPGETPTTAVAGKDTGTRYELGWNSRELSNTVAGLELVLFKVENDVADYHGLAINLTLGGKR